MSDDVQHIKALREAFKEGAHWARNLGSDRTPDEAAAHIYPMPTVEVPRVVRSKDGWEYRLVDGAIQQRLTDGGDWIHALGVLERTHAINNLLANPTERKPVDEVAP